MSKKEGRYLNSFESSNSLHEFMQGDLSSLENFYKLYPPTFSRASADFNKSKVISLCAKFIASSKNLIFTKNLFKKNSENSSDKVKIRKSASECRYYLHDRDDYSHILAFRWTVIRVFNQEVSYE